MRRQMALVVTLALAVSGTAVAQDDKKEADKANLKGVWVLKSGVASGKAAPQELIGKLTITFGPDNKFVMEGGKKKSKAPVFRHDNCHVSHRSAEAAARCRNS